MHFPVALLALLATPAAAIPHPKRAFQVTDTIVSDLDFYAQYTSAAYCNYDTAVGSPVTCSDGCPDVQANNATVVASFIGDATGLAGFVATDPVTKTIVMSFKGSNSVRNWLANVLFGFSSCSDLVANCKIHTGFQAGWDEISSRALAGLAAARAAHPDYTVITTGHSLGGAIANFAAATIRVTKSIPVTVYSYGSPRVGNDVYANMVIKQTSSGTLGSEFRVTHVDDPVPRLPPIIFGYRHTSPELWLSSGGATTTDYTAKDIKVCEGTTNLACNGGTLGLDVDAHSRYFQQIGGCGDGFTWKRDTDEVDDATLTDRVNQWAEQDRQYVDSLAAGGSN